MPGLDAWRNIIRTFVYWIRSLPQWRRRRIRGFPQSSANGGGGAEREKWRELRGWPRTHEGKKAQPAAAGRAPFEGETLNCSRLWFLRDHRFHFGFPLRA